MSIDLRQRQRRADHDSPGIPRERGQLGDRVETHEQRRAPVPPVMLDARGRCPQPPLRRPAVRSGSQRIPQPSLAAQNLCTPSAGCRCRLTQSRNESAGGGRVECSRGIADWPVPGATTQIARESCRVTCTTPAGPTVLGKQAHREAWGAVAALRTACGSQCAQRLVIAGRGDTLDGQHLVSDNHRQQQEAAVDYAVGASIPWGPTIAIAQAPHSPSAQPSLLPVSPRAEDIRAT